MTCRIVLQGETSERLDSSLSQLRSQLQSVYNHVTGPAAERLCQGDRLWADTQNTDDCRLRLDRDTFATYHACFIEGLSLLTCKLHLYY